MGVWILAELLGCEGREFFEIACFDCFCKHIECGRELGFVGKGNKIGASMMKLSVWISFCGVSIIHKLDIPLDPCVTFVDNVYLFVSIVLSTSCVP